jgi:hypothetical protein
MQVLLLSMLRTLPRVTTPWLLLLQGEKRGLMAGPAVSCQLLLTNAGVCCLMAAPAV